MAVKKNDVVAFVLLGICIATAVSAAAAASADPQPPLWDPAFKFIGAAVIQSTNRAFSVQYQYRWDIPAVSQVLTNDVGAQFTILHVNNNTWRVSPGNKSCCLCTNPTACGHVKPPRPDWLRAPPSNETKYLGVSAINERECHGWVKTNDVASFGWWTSVRTGVPCQLAWLLGETITMPMSYYTNDIALIPASVFAVPDYCVYHETDPKCNISDF